MHAHAIEVHHHLHVVKSALNVVQHNIAVADVEVEGHDGLLCTGVGELGYVGDEIVLRPAVAAAFAWGALVVFFFVGGWLVGVSGSSMASALALVVVSSSSVLDNGEGMSGLDGDAKKYNKK